VVSDVLRPTMCKACLPHYGQPVFLSTSEGLGGLLIQNLVGLFEGLDLLLAA